MRSHLFYRQRGFTLLEAVTVMVITGILATMIFSFVKLPVRNYLTAVARAGAVDMADNSMRRLTRDLRLALPNSVRQSGNFIEYLETKAGLRYLGDDDINTPAGGLPLNWDVAAATVFTVAGGMPTGRLLPTTSDSIVIYNLGELQSPANAYDCTVSCNRTGIVNVDTAASTLKMTSNVFAAQTAAGVALKSPAKRFHVLTGPVSYGCDTATGRLTRYWGYPITSSQATPPIGGSRAILAENLTGCAFSYATMANQRSGLINIRLDVQVQDDSKASVSLYHQVHVDNTP